MTPDVLRMFALIAVGAAWLVTHVALLIRTARAKKLSRALRWAALLPPVLPVAAWLAGARVPVVLWVTEVAAYAMLRSAA